MVQIEIDIKLSAIGSKVLNVLIARKEIRRPCCRREPPRDVWHLYRKLAPIYGARKCVTYFVIYV